MNERQEKLYNYLKRKDYPVTQEQIARELPFDYQRHIERSSKANSTAFRLIRKDIHDINDEMPMTIVHKDGGYKIASKEEVEDFLERRLKNHKKQIAYDFRIMKKVGLHNQMNYFGEIYKAYEDER